MGRDPATTDLPAIMSIEIIWLSLNFNSFREFTVMELRNLGNNLGLFNTNMMLNVFCILY